MNRENGALGTPSPLVNCGAKDTNSGRGTMGETLASIMNSRRAMSAELRNVNDYLQVALDNMARGVSMFDEKQRLILSNKMYGQIYGIPDQLTRPGTPLSAIIRWYIKSESGNDGAIDVSGHLAWIRNEVTILAQGQLRTRTQVLFNGRAVRITTQPLPNGGWVDVQEDISEQSAKESALGEIARKDPLTGLPNRIGFHDAVGAALRDRGDKASFAVHLIDVGNFQSVKERFGFAVREALMGEVGKAIGQLVSPPDLAARVDGDLFAVLCPETTSEQAARGLVERLEATLSAPFDVYGHRLDARVRVATVFAPVDGKDAAHLINSGLQHLHAARH